MVETYYLGWPCKRGHTGPRYLSTRQCRQCVLERPRPTAEQSRQSSRTHYYSHRETALERARVWRANNLALYLQIKADSYRPERAKAWWTSNPGKRALYNAKRKAHLIKATPIWLTVDQKAEIEAMYMQAAEMTLTTGIRYEVDHIIPLISSTVRGLHVPWNLQILTKEENLKKGNRY